MEAVGMVDDHLEDCHRRGIGTGVGLVGSAVVAATP
jgi:hypothetical protein